MPLASSAPCLPSPRLRLLAVAVLAAVAAPAAHAQPLGLADLFPEVVAARFPDSDLAAHDAQAPVPPEPLLRLDPRLGQTPSAPAGSASAPDEDAPPRSAPTPIPLRLSPQLAPALRGSAARQLPVFLEADTLEGRAGQNVVAQGNARLRRGSLTLRADRLEHTTADNTVHATGGVRIDRLGDVYSGPELQLQLDSGTGFFLSPQYRFARTGAGGQAERIDFIDDQHVVASDANYTSCTPEDGEGPAWVLSTSRVSMDFEQDVGVAENAVVRFYDVPILGWPRLTFPLSDRRKSGWLPPSFDINSRSGFEIELPYYWNIAPNYDATLTPTFAVRRGAGLDAEFRYLERRFDGQARLVTLPHDKLYGSERWLGQFNHDQRITRSTDLRISALRVSDDDYWKDFPRSIAAQTYWHSGRTGDPALTPRLLSTSGGIEQRIAPSSLGLDAAKVWDLSWFARVQDWQVLQLTSGDTSSEILPPYRRMPQLGLQGSGEARGWMWSVDTQFNRFTNDPAYVARGLAEGSRVHAIGRVSYPWEPLGADSGWTITPALRMQATSYAMDDPLADGRTHTSRFIPTLSLDSAWVFERPSRWFGSDYRQTLEPRIQYLRTPYHDQSALPIFDSAPLDFNIDTIYFDNAFSGVDRVSDANQFTAGLTTRIFAPQSGAEALRLGAVQRYLLRDQRITPSGQPLTQRLSDLLLLGSTSVIPQWTLATTLQYDSNANNLANSTFIARYSPGAWRTVSATFRETRGVNKQLDIGWQWPIAGRMPSYDEAEADRMSSGRASSGTCGGKTWYSVGRFNYNLLGKRITDSLFGIEYDGGCWVGRVVAERLSTGRAEATTRLMFQLELVGLSRLGTSPLRSLKDNIPGYRLLRDVRGVVASPESPEPLSSTDD